MMKKGSRIALLLASLALGLVYVLPIWRITLEAPQYPEGLGMVIRVNTIHGIKPHDLDNINNLNHYIGMKRIEPDAIPELEIMPLAVGVLMALGLLVAALGRRWGLYAWTGLFLLVAAVGLADFWKWEYDYGHNLDEENAIIKVPGMSYQPPLIGSRQILNFKAHSWPGAGGWILILVGAGATLLSVTEFRQGRKSGAGDSGESGTPPAGPSPNPTVSLGIVAFALASAAVLSACGAPAPRDLAYGVDSCERCLMTLAEPGYGAELVTPTGKIYTFDSVECLVAFLQEDGDVPETHSLWVTDFSNPQRMVPAPEAFYLVSATLPSPMGMGLTAFGRSEDRDGAVNAFGGEALDWESVQSLVATRMGGRREQHPGHGGHSVAMAEGEAGS